MQPPVKCLFSSRNSALLNCLLINARSICNKLDLLPATIDECNAKIILLTETWLTSDYPDSFFSFQDRYKVYRKDRDSRIGGGVCALVSCDLPSVSVCIPRDYDKVEVVAFDLLLNSVKFRIIVGYRPPTSEYSTELYAEQFCQCLHVLTSVPYTSIVTGDFNLPFMQWENYNCPNDKINLFFAELFQTAGFIQFVKKPTRLCNILDVVLCNDQLVISDCSTLPPLGNSDHDVVCFEMLIPSCGTKYYSEQFALMYDFKKADYVAMNRFLLEQDWYLLLTDTIDVEILWNRFRDILNTAIDRFVPHKQSSNVKHLSKYPLYIRQLFRKKRAAWRAAKRSKNSVSYQAKYNTINKKCIDAVAYFVRRKEEELIQHNNLGSFYKYVNSKTGTKASIGILRDRNNLDITTDQSKADAFNDFFSAAFTCDNGHLPSLDRIVDASIKLDDITFTYEYVMKVITRLKPKHSAGPDGFSPFLIKHLAHSIALPLMLLFSASFVSGSLPAEWKTAIVTPVFKKGLSNDVNNYRPISLTSIICRIMESVIKLQLVDYLLKHDLITKQQHGFLFRRSTCTQLLECTNDWSLSLNVKKSTDVVYVDFSKAFDSVSHSKLHVKLEAYGIEGKLLSWLSAYLDNRSQMVKVGNCFSSCSAVLSGVPQGSVLGPVLFLVFINDIVHMFGDGVTVKLFADDVKIYVTINDVNDKCKLQNGLDALLNWSVEWQLNVCPSKCMVLHIGSCNSDLNYEMNGKPLPAVREIRDLGIIVDKDLKFNKHICTVVSKAHQRASLILRCFKSRDPSLLFKAFITYARPIVEYCSPVWNPHYVANINKIESVQRRFTKRLLGFKNLPYFTRLDLVNAETLEFRRLILDLTMVFKVLNEIVFVDGSSLFQLQAPVYCTRGHDMRIQKQFCRVNSRAHNFNCRVVSAWNSLPITVIKSPSVYAFKRLVRQCSLSQFLTVTD